MTLDELAKAVGVPARQIRFMIAEGCVPPARVRGPAADPYGEEHLAQALRYTHLHGLGFAPAAIKVLMAFDDAIPVFQENGVEVRVGKDFDPRTFDADAVIDAIRSALLRFAGKAATEENEQ